MKLFKISKSQNFGSLIKNQILFSKKFSTGEAIKTKKSFLLNKSENTAKIENKVPVSSSKSDKFQKKVSAMPGSRKEQLMQVEMGKGGLQGVKGLQDVLNKKEDKDKVKIKENYACVYYKFPIDQEFDLFKLRNLLYAYIFTRQRKGHIYLNFADSIFKVKKII
jgi:hypothetical protein